MKIINAIVTVIAIITVYAIAYVHESSGILALLAIIYLVTLATDKKIAVGILDGMQRILGRHSK